MANASKDANNVSSLIVALNTNGSTIVRVLVDGGHALQVSDGTTGTDHGPVHALHDENFVPTAMGVSSSDFKTPVVVYGDVSGNLLIKST